MGINLSYISQNIHYGRLDIDRLSMWSDTDVADLLDSLVNNYPIGNIYLYKGIETTEYPFIYDEFSKPCYIVDGYKRIMFAYMIISKINCGGIPKIPSIDHESYMKIFRYQMEIKIIEGNKEKALKIFSRLLKPRENIFDIQTRMLN